MRHDVRMESDMTATETARDIRVLQRRNLALATLAFVVTFWRRGT